MRAFIVMFITIPANKWLYIKKILVNFGKTQLDSLFSSECIKTQLTNLKGKIDLGCHRWIVYANFKDNVQESMQIYVNLCKFAN